MSQNPIPQTIVGFPVELELPNGAVGELSRASLAVRQEYRQSTKSKRLCCLDVIPVSQDDDESIYALEVGQSVEFDWSWEGATASRTIDDFDDLAESTLDQSSSGQHCASWSGEVVEVDEANGRIFIWIGNNKFPPRRGYFYIRPFEFLATLHSVFCEPVFERIREFLSGRLLATKGGIHPQIPPPPQTGTPHLLDLWNYSWSILWGPPGTGKTFTIGKQVASCIRAKDERILVVSTTNKATDEVARSIGLAARALKSADIESGVVLRIGKSAHFETYHANSLEGMLRGTETDILRRIGHLKRTLTKEKTHESRATIRKDILSLTAAMRDASYAAFVSRETRVVISTAFKALTMLNRESIRRGIESRQAPFTTVILDEAGLISRATVAAMSLLASRRVILAGDPKQLAPISRMSRILPTDQAEWLASSGLSHLRDLGNSHPAVHFLREQHRMHPHVCSVVSAYQYENLLLSADSVTARKPEMPKLLLGHPRSIWYVLDEDGDDLPSIRAERGPGNKSWVRNKTREVLKKLFTDEGFAEADGLFMSPFLAQTRDIKRFFAEEHLDSWWAATVHSQQGAEKDFVIFDTVNAGSYAWPYDEWRRLVNVALSRAREFVLVIASRAEMREPYLKPLTFDLAPRVLKWAGKAYRLVQVPAEPESSTFFCDTDRPSLIGNQIARRKSLRPVLSSEQQRLCSLELDGKPRLVRGVAGSGKTAILANWLIKTVQRFENKAEARIWAVFANQSLQGLIKNQIEEAWRMEGIEKNFPWERVNLWHVKYLLDDLLREFRVKTDQIDQFDYDAKASACLSRCEWNTIRPRCHALFVDEAQDMGPDMLRLLTALVEPSNSLDPKSRSVHIFYDNAQNLFARKTPRWSELGLDMRGRSTVLKESFRSTRPITEFALNVLYTLQPSELNSDHKELVDRGLLELTNRNGQGWWRIRFNQIDGPPPIVKKFRNLESQIDAIGSQITTWITQEAVRPSDICIIYNGQPVCRAIEKQLRTRLRAINVNLAIETGKTFTAEANSVTVTTAHSFKGYDSEIIVIAGADRFTAKGKGVLANNLYVAMTRARSILAIFGEQCKTDDACRITAAIDRCLESVCERAITEVEVSSIDEFENLLHKLGKEHRDWLLQVNSVYRIRQEPIFAEDGEIVAEPLFWFEARGVIYANFGSSPISVLLAERIHDAGIRDIVAGGALP